MGQGKKTLAFMTQRKSEMLGEKSRSFALRAELQHIADQNKPSSTRSGKKKCTRLRRSQRL